MVERAVIKKPMSKVRKYKTSFFVISWKFENSATKIRNLYETLWYMFDQSLQKLKEGPKA